MKGQTLSTKVSVVTFAVLGALTAMSARADDEEIAKLTQPKNTVDVQVIYVNQGSAKFGEYNGLDRSGLYLNGNLGLRGGDAYTNNENGGTTRWSVTGTNLGLSNRSANASISDQGNWNLGVNYDALTHYLTDSYQTPYLGTMGGNSFTLPKTFGLAANTMTLNAAQLGSFQNMGISTTRQNTSLTATKYISSNLSVTFDYNHLDQNGAKLMAFGSGGFNGATGERVSILPMPTNYQTDTFNMAVNWRGDKARIGASYFGSFFQDAYNSVNFMTFAGANVMQQMSTMPSNQFQQLNLNGGYDFTSKTKLISNLSFGRSTQSASSGFDAVQMLGGVPSYNGIVNTKHADVKLIDQTVKNLTLSALYRYDERADLSSSDMYYFNAISGANPAYYPNTPLSFKKSVAEASAVYRLTKDQTLGLTYANQQIVRWCNNYATGGGGNPTSSYPGGTDCVTANSSAANSLNAFYKLRATEDLNFRFAYGTEVRKTTWDQNAITAMSGANVNNAAFAQSMVPGQNGGDYLGYQPFFEASRVQQNVKASVNWQATEALSFGVNGRYLYDNYTDSTYGVQNGSSWSVNLDATYSYSDTGSVVAYATQQNGQRKLNNYYYSTGTAATSILYNGTWGNTLVDNATTVGLGFKQTGLMGNKLSLSADATYSLATTAYDTTLNNTGTTVAGQPLSCSSSASTVSPTLSGACGAPPTIRNAMMMFKLTAAYQIDKTQRISLQYMFQHLDTNDYFFNGYQYGYTPTSVMPTNQTSPNYNVNVIMLMYRFEL